MQPQLSTTEFDLLRKYIQEISGICLDDSKTILMESRLSPLLKTFECNSYLDLYKRASHKKEISREICNAISTNETSFFRDQRVYDMIRDNCIPYFLNKSTSINIWSAASSFGQEPYSLAMILHETIRQIEKYNIKIEATDISNEAIAYASYGLYTKYEVARGIDEQRLFKHFDLVERGFRVKDKLRYDIHFRELNLLKTIPFGNQFDIILCRNVAIYFDAETKKHLFNSLAKCLRPNGRLILGSTESLWQVTDIFHRQEADGLVYYTLEKDPPD